MKQKKIYRSGEICVFLLVFLFFAPPFAPLPGANADPLYSPTWGFRLDLPPDYQLAGGDGAKTFSFQGPEGASLDIAVYESGFPSVEHLAANIKTQLKSRGEISVFEYRHKKAALLELAFSASPPRGAQAMTGWGLCVELKKAEGRGAGPLLAALATGPGALPALQELHLSVLDSLAPEEGDNRAPGPITEFSCPRQTRKKAAIPGTGLEAWVYEEDREAAQSLVDREFDVLRRYVSSPLWKDAWIRFYRAIYRDSFERLADIAFMLERYWNVPPGKSPSGSAPSEEAAQRNAANLALAAKALAWVQSFKYERDLLGSDFVNLVSAALEGRGDCDSRALLWALILNQADIPAGVMVSRDYSHAMGLADLPGQGARFEADGKKWLVAETTAPVSIGLIGEKVSDPRKWLAVTFE